MKQFEKWVRKLAEAKNGDEFYDTLNGMYADHIIIECCGNKERCDNTPCGSCMVQWLDSEAEES